MEIKVETEERRGGREAVTKGARSVRVENMGVMERW